MKRTPLTVSRYRNTVQNNLCLCKCKNVLVWLSSGYLEREEKKKKVFFETKTLQLPQSGGGEPAFSFPKFVWF